MSPRSPLLWRGSPPIESPDCRHTPPAHYAALVRPQDAGEFITAGQGRSRTPSDRFEQAPAEGSTGGMSIVRRHGEL
ncbi:MULTISPECIES: hypothetical protein [Streptomyces]|uniref:hypothetical protein n=1 Tax=Streptomyces TaxID=1883 RepID=UPI0004C7E4C2|nr:hypothetical protein [Streptomyces sp. NRRL F-5053]